MKVSQPARSLPLKSCRHAAGSAAATLPTNPSARSARLRVNFGVIIARPRCPDGSAPAITVRVTPLHFICWPRPAPSSRTPVTTSMNLDTARSSVIAALGRMNHLYNQPVFDEWVLVKLASESGAILAYSGPRADTYQKQFKSDIVLLRAELEQQKLSVGDFAFVHGADGTQYDACIRLGT